MSSQRLVAEMRLRRDTYPWQHVDVVFEALDLVTKRHLKFTILFFLYAFNVLGECTSLVVLRALELLHLLLLDLLQLLAFGLVLAKNVLNARDLMCQLHGWQRYKSS